MTQHSSKRERDHLPKDWLKQLHSKVKKDGQKAGLSNKKINRLLENFEKSLSKDKHQKL